MLRGMVITALLAITLVAGAGPSWGQIVEGVTCPDTVLYCYVAADQPGTPGKPAPSGSGSTGTGCVLPNSTREMPCSSDLWGSFNSADGCYYQRVDQQPDASHPVWGGQSPEGRVVYQRACYLPGGGAFGNAWVTLDAVAATVVTASPAQVAMQAIAQMTLLGPQITMAPPADALGLVGIPVWMWTDASAATWGPVTATASVTGVSVTATANASKIVWNMGDDHTVTCHGPGTPYTGGDFTKSPDCGYVYPQSSAGQPGNAYTVTATTTWGITWTGGGQSGTLTTTRESTTQLQIGELQVLNQ